MKTTFKKIAAISLAALTLGLGSCITSFAAEYKGETDEKENVGYYEDIAPDFENGEWDYDYGYTFYDEWSEYEYDIPGAIDCLACE